MRDALERVEVLFFDVFGTVVDWRTSVIRELEQFGQAKGLDRDWAAFADSWRDKYQPHMEEVRAGRRPFVILDVLHREGLLQVLDEFKIDRPTDSELHHLTTIWHRLGPWPDTVAGLQRLKQRFIISPLSNGNIGLLTRLSKYAGLPWDVILGAETAAAYKPDPKAYLKNAEVLGLEPQACMLVAAHNYDLGAARALGFKTALVFRKTEHGPDQKTDLTAKENWDVITDSFENLATALKCPPLA